MEIKSKAMAFFQHMADKAENAECVKLAGKSDFNSLALNLLMFILVDVIVGRILIFMLSLHCN